MNEVLFIVQVGGGFDLVLIVPGAIFENVIFVVRISVRLFGQDASYGCLSTCYFRVTSCVGALWFQASYRYCVVRGCRTIKSIGDFGAYAVQWYARSSFDRVL